MKLKKIIFIVLLMISFVSCESQNKDSKNIKEEKTIYKYSNENAALSVLHYVTNTTVLLVGDQMIEKDFNSFEMISGNSTVEENEGNGKVYITYEYSIRGERISVSQSFNVINYGIVDVRGTEQMVVSNQNAEIACPNFNKNEERYINISLVNKIYNQYYESGEENITSILLRSDETGKLIISKDIKCIRSDAFDYVCSNSIDIYYEGTIEDWCNIKFIDIPGGLFPYIEHFYTKINNSWVELINLEIPNSITSIGDYQFFYFENIKKIAISDNIKNIGKNAFYGCNKLESVSIGNNVTSIGDGAFQSCSNLTNITIPDSVISIGEYSFGWCSKLESIKIGKGITKVGVDAFGGCDSLEKVYYNGKIENWCNITFDYYDSNPMSKAEQFYILDKNNSWIELTYLDIPETVKSIGKYQFYSFEHLTSVKIPNNVIEIGVDAFEMCESLKNVEFLNGLIDIHGAFSFDPFATEITITIPKKLNKVFMDEIICSFYFFEKIIIYYKGTMEDLNKTINELSDEYYFEIEIVRFLSNNFLYLLDENGEWYDATDLLN